MRTNLRLLARQWASARALQRYYIASQLSSGVLLGLLSLLSIGTMLAGQRDAGLGLLAGAALCFVHTLASWSVLRRRYNVRYEAFKLP